MTKRSLLLSAALFFRALDLGAQACVAPDRLAGMFASGSSCVYGDPHTRCAPGDAITFRASLWAGMEEATCPVEATWDFGDGSAPLTTTQREVQHTFFNAGEFRPKVTVQFASGPQSFTHYGFTIAHGFLDVSAFPATVDEGQPVTVSILRQGDLSKPGSVQYATSGAFQTQFGIVTFASGESRKDVTVLTIDDSIDNPELFRLAQIEISYPTGGWLVDESNGGAIASVSVRDNDLPVTHQCAQSAITISEAAGAIVFELERSGNLSVATTGFVGISWDRFDLHGRFSVPFAAGESNKLLSVPFANDSVYHGSESTTVVCGGEGQGVSSSTSTLLLTVLEDEPPPALIAPDAIDIDETDQAQVLTIPISFVPPYGHMPRLDVRIAHATTSSADVKLLDYSPDEIEIEITGDELAEPDEIASIVITTSGAWGKVLLTIRDDDRPPFPYSFDRVTYDFQERDGGSVTIQRTGSLDAAVALVMSICADPPSNCGNPIPVTLASGEAAKAVPLTLDDSFYTGSRTMILQLELDGFVGTTAILNVIDDETAPSLSIGDASGREGNLDQRTRLEVPLTLSAPLGVPLSVRVVASHVTTDANDLAMLEQTVTIPAGDLQGKALFEINGDIDLEEDETFSITISDCCVLATVARGTATATIVNDDETPTESLYRLSLASAEVKEVNKWLVVPVLRLGRVSVPSQVTLKLTFDDSRQFAPRTIRFAAGETRKETRYYIHDALYSGTANVQIEVFDGPRLVASAPVKILEGDGRPRIFGAASAREGIDQAIRLDLVVSPPSSRPLSMHMRAVTGGTASVGYDFPPFEQDLLIPAGAISFPVEIPIHDDRIIEGYENIFFAVTDADGSETSGPIVTIYDDDSPYLRFPSRVLRGKPVEIVLQLPVPAPEDDSIQLLVDRNVLEGPETIPVPKGARSVTFTAAARKAGDLEFVVALPYSLEPSTLRARLKEKITIYEQHTITANPGVIELTPGESLSVGLTIAPTNANYVLRSADRNVAQFERGNGTVVVHAQSVGQTEIVIELSASAGGAQLKLPVIVSEPKTTGKRRGVHH